MGDRSTSFLCYRLLRNTISGLVAPWYIARDISKPLTLDTGSFDADDSVDNEDRCLKTRDYIIALCVEEEQWSKIHVVLTRKDKLMFLIEYLESRNADSVDEHSITDAVDWSL